MIRRTYFSRIVTGFIDGEDAIDRLQSAIPVHKIVGMKIHKDMVQVHKTHIIEPKSST